MYVDVEDGGIRATSLAADRANASASIVATKDCSSISDMAQKNEASLFFFLLTRLI